MNSLSIHAMNLMVGVLIGVGGIVALVGRFDRSGESGCFYRLLLLLIAATIAVIVLGAAGS